MARMSRREFLQIAAGGGALLASEPVSRAVDKLIPYVIQPEKIRPGVWVTFATTCRECPAGCGMHVRTMDGRALKAEGNPVHPINSGGLCARGQSSLQGLYDPDRVRNPLVRKGAKRDKTDWTAALGQIAARIRQGGRVAVMSDIQTGAMAEIMEAFAKTFGGRVLYYEPFNYEALREAHQRAFGVPAIPDYRIDQCELVVTFAADFLETWISPVEFARAFSQMRAYKDKKVGRMVYFGPRLSMTAANASECFLVPPGQELPVALGMLNVIVEKGWAKAGVEFVKKAMQDGGIGKMALPSGVSQGQVEALARAFVQAAGSVALAGPAGATSETAIQTCLAAALLNYAAGRVGRTVDFSRQHALGSAATEAQARGFLSRLSADDVLFIHNANPAFALNGAAEDIGRAGMVVYLGTMPDETAMLADWVLPTEGPLESWGDYEPWSGIHGLMQPTTARLFDTLPAGDILLELARRAGKTINAPAGNPAAPASFMDWLRGRWEGMGGRLAATQPAADFWKQCLQNGGCWEQPAPAPLALKGGQGLKLSWPGAGSGSSSGGVTTMPSAAPATGASAELWVWPSILFFDGRTANRPWLQEAPDPVSYAVWSSWVDVHPEKARVLGLADGDIVELKTHYGAVEAPARITEDQPPEVVALAFGQGHTALGQEASVAMEGDKKVPRANAFKLLGEVKEGRLFPAVTLRKTGRRYETIYSGFTQAQHGRKIMQWVTLSEVSKLGPGEGDQLILPLPEGYREGKDIYKPRQYKHRWAMAIDLHRCIGCGACAVACYAENNVAVVGPKWHRNFREMAWLKIVPYRKQDDPRRLGFLPMLCQQCDAAPCEPVCPVFASVHNEEGLNAQVYNRCVGTRYCANNCPYKVRRFNWLNVQWGPAELNEAPKGPVGPYLAARAPLHLQLNPDVTVRSRGVMEKCTFCIQRIRQAQHQAKRENREVRDGEIQPACAQSCPAEVFTFGDLADPDSQVTRLTRKDPRRYHVLEELNTKPAIAYLRRIDDSEKT